MEFCQLVRLPGLPPPLTLAVPPMVEWKKLESSIGCWYMLVLWYDLLLYKVIQFLRSLTFLVLTCISFCLLALSESHSTSVRWGPRKVNSSSIPSQIQCKKDEKVWFLQQLCFSFWIVFSIVFEGSKYRAVKRCIRHEYGIPANGTECSFSHHSRWYNTLRGGQYQPQQQWNVVWCTLWNASIPM